MFINVGPQIFDDAFNIVDGRRTGQPNGLFELGHADAFDPRIAELNVFKGLVNIVEGVLVGFHRIEGCFEKIQDLVRDYGSDLGSTNIRFRLDPGLGTRDQGLGTRDQGLWTTDFRVSKCVSNKKPLRLLIA